MFVNSVIKLNGDFRSQVAIKKWLLIYENYEMDLKYKCFVSILW